MRFQAAVLCGAFVTGGPFSKQGFVYINNFVSLSSFSGGQTSFDFPYCAKPVPLGAIPSISASRIKLSGLRRKDTKEIIKTKVRITYEYP